MYSVEDTYMHKPCPNCPFRKKNGITCLGKNRATSIIKALQKEGFDCHETTGVKHDGNKKTNRRQCAGSMILSIKSDKPNLFVGTYVAMFGKQPELTGFDDIVNNEQEFIKIQSTI